eukprot:TRINITY_DN18989_c0_g2_i1.p1 TRINITY_DN18989_c0_g2~~TRINITY_DN18989_c0_g2_i1.p1  ORF type:complete len:266 (+),score=26.27 TRINITY_DN18989_c0_g2_i1:86-883(+)
MLVLRRGSRLASAKAVQRGSLRPFSAAAEPLASGFSREWKGPLSFPIERKRRSTRMRDGKRDPDLPPRGAHYPREYDEKHGRWWSERTEVFRPKLFSSIGRHARHPDLSPLLIRWVYSTPGFRKLARDKYRKRWPASENLCARFFAEFCLKNFSDRTLLETAHTLPLYGVGCKFWRGNRPEAADTQGRYFVADDVDFRLRPIRGFLRGVQHINGRPARKGITPVAKSMGSWRYEYPAGAHPAVYRAPFPTLASASEEAAEPEEAE